MKKICALLVATITLFSTAHMASAEDTTTSTSVPESTTSTTVANPATQKLILEPRDIIEVSRVNTKRSVVFITIDDGATVSPELAQLLDKQHVPVTTFAMPGMLWRAKKWYRQRQNMTFENHTNTHAHMTIISPQKQARELCVASSLISRIMKVRPIMYRPPRGSWIQPNRVAMARCGLKYKVMWSSVIQSDVPPGTAFRKGDIILFHYVPSLPYTLKAVLDILKLQKLRPALLRDYLK